MSAVSAAATERPPTRNIPSTVLMQRDRTAPGMIEIIASGCPGCIRSVRRESSAAGPESGWTLVLPLRIVSVSLPVDHDTGIIADNPRIMPR